MDAILDHSVGARGCIAVELRIPERKHGMVKSEFDGGAEEGSEEGKMG